MIPTLLTRIKTRDGITLDGIYVAPKRKGTVALVWVHGLQSSFYGGHNRIRKFSLRCQKNRIGFFCFNTRGHDIVASGSKQFLGSAFEKFEDCIFDIRAMINFARSLGYKKIILAGHSTGANKAVYYLYKTRNSPVCGLVLLAPISDIAYDYMAFGKHVIKNRVAIAKKIQQRSGAFSLLPKNFGIWAARRYVSIVEEGRPEDVFPYYNPQSRWKELKGIKVPLAIVVGSRDQYLDRSPKEFLGAFQKNAVGAQSFSGYIIKGASHGFQKKEKELAETVMRWIKTGM